MGGGPLIAKVAVKAARTEADTQVPPRMKADERKARSMTVGPGEEDEHDGCPHDHADADEVAQLGESGKAAEIEREKGRRRRAGGPENISQRVPLEVAQAALLVPGLLIDEVSVVHTQSNHDRGEAHPEDGELFEEKPGQPHRNEENDDEHGE